MGWGLRGGWLRGRMLLFEGRWELVLLDKRLFGVLVVYSGVAFCEWMGSQELFLLDESYAFTMLIRLIHSYPCSWSLILSLRFFLSEVRG